MARNKSGIDYSIPRGQNKRLRTKECWENMIKRCNSDVPATRKVYKDRGITVCDRWKDSFLNFVEDMKECDLDLFLDRIDGTKGYYRENCRWVSANVNNWNRDFGPYRGVSWHKPTQKWRARLNYAGREFYLGLFDDRDEAKEFYDSHARIIDWLIEERLLR